MIRIIFSWDDGAKEDLKLLDLLAKHSISSMLFIPAHNPERSVLDKREILQVINSGQEVGAHTFSHLYLTQINKNDIAQELTKGKSFLEDIIGEEVNHFCFPGGFYNTNIIYESLKLFKSVRTAKSCYLQNSQYIINPTFHFFDRGYRSLLFHSFKNSPQIFKLLLRNNKNFNYFDFLKITLDTLSRKNKDFDFHIWGHSWELENENLWIKLDSFLNYVNLNYSQYCIPYSKIIK